MTNRWTCLFAINSLDQSLSRNQLKKEMEGLSILSRQIYGMCDIVLYETNLQLYQP